MSSFLKENNQLLARPGDSIYADFTAEQDELERPLCAPGLRCGRVFLLLRILNTDRYVSFAVTLTGFIEHSDPVLDSAGHLALTFFERWVVLEARV